MTHFTNTRRAFADGFGRALIGFAPFSGAAAFARGCSGLLHAQAHRASRSRKRIAHHVLARDKGVD